MLSAVTFTSIDISERLLDWVIRLLVSAVCGFAIGYERKTRSKEAGIRTHTIVCMASALFMIISKYGFADQTVGALGVRGADSARIAAQVVSGMGFLGAGIIFYRRDVLHGLTTAAGIWVTAAIGMAIGSGMYVIGVIAAIVLILLQVILHRPFRIMKGRVVTTLHMTVKMDDESTVDKINYIFGVKKFLKFKTIASDSGELSAEIDLVTEKSFTVKELYDIAKNNEFIRTLEKTDEI